MKTITNEEFMTAWKNNQYARIMSTASRQLSKGMTKAEIRTCRMDALWRSMAGYNPEKSKFETYLYNYTRWTFLNQISQRELPRNVKEVSLSNLGYDIVKEDEEEKQIINFDRMLEKLDAEQSQLVKEYYLEKYSMSDMAKKRKCSRQCIHLKIQRAIRTLRESENPT